MGTDRDRDQAEGDVCEWLEPGERGFSEEVESGPPDENAADDLSRDSGESDAPSESAEENARDENDREQKQRFGVMQ